MLISKVFVDIADISHHEAPTSCSTTASVDDAFLYSCGFCCQSVSKANPSAKNYIGCCESGKGKTGSTYQQSRSYIAQHLPVLVLLENVGGLSAQDRLRVKEDLMALGYKVIVLQSNAIDHHLPSRRVRVWFLCCLDPDDCNLFPASIAQERAVAMERGTRCTSQEMEGLVDKYLVPEDDALFDILKQMKQDDHPDKERVSKKILKPKHKLKWIQKHKTFWKNMRRAGALRNRKGKPQFTQHGKLSKRETDIVRAELIQHEKDYIPGQKVFIDVSQSIHRYPRSVGAAPTILPGGHICVVSRGLCDSPTADPVLRPLYGLEALRLQGLHESMLPNPGSIFSFRDSDLLGLAGNAFSFVHIHLAMLCLLSGFSMPGSKQEILERRELANQKRSRRSLPRRRWKRLM